MQHLDRDRVARLARELAGGVVVKPAAVHDAHAALADRIADQRLCPSRCRAPCPTQFETGGVERFVASRTAGRSARRCRSRCGSERRRPRALHYVAEGRCRTLADYASLLPAQRSVPSARRDQRMKLPRRPSSSPLDHTPEPPRPNGGGKKQGRSAWPKGLVAATALLSTLASSAPAAAQNLDGEFTVQRFNPAPGPRNFITTRGARTDGEMAFSAGLVLNYANEPFVVRSCLSSTDCESPGAQGQTDIKVVENMFTGDLMGTLTPIPRVQLGLRVPITWVKGHGISEAGPAEVAPGLEAVGVGDAEVEGKVRLHGEPRDTFVAGASLFLTGPLGHLTAENNYIGDSTPSIGVRGIMDGKSGPASFGGNLAGVLRGSGRVGNTEIGHEFRYGVAGGYEFSPVLRVVARRFRSHEIQQPPGHQFARGRWRRAGGAAGSPILIHGRPRRRRDRGSRCAEVPRLRRRDVHRRAAATAMATRSRTKRISVRPSPKICDGRDDSDGCPDADDDGDTIGEPADRCPAQAEDPDGFEDTDGCPEHDNDRDGVQDVSDRCPDKPETRNGFKDDDGCPDEPDTDLDGVPDAKDQCPKEKEDTDGFNDTDGCPDPDNDGDGVPDEQDECIDEAETQNGVDDTDGCPEQPPAGGAAPP